MEHCIYCGKKLEGARLCPQCGHEIREYKKLDAFTGDPVSARVAEDLEKMKVNLFIKGDFKKMTEAVKNGEVFTTPIIVEKLFTLTHSVDEDDYEESVYANISDLDGAPCDEAPRILDMYKGTELVNAREYLLSYKLKKTHFYVVIDEEAYDQIADTLKLVLSMSYLDPTSRSLPVLEGSLADRGGKLLSGLFKKFRS